MAAPPPPSPADETAPAARPRFRLFGRSTGMFGFRLSLGITSLYLSLLVLVPVSALALRAAKVSPHTFVAAVTTKRALAAFALSFGASLVAAAINTVFGTIVAWVLVRYRFFGRGLCDALVDLPFALPTAVGGIALTAVYAPTSPIGGALARLGLQAAFSRLGVVIALVFVSVPFVIRTVGPVLADIDHEQEEAASMLGASRLMILRRVIWPALAPAALTGFSLSFARALGEYGSVVFISGNLPRRTEIVPFLIMSKLEQFDYAGATAVASVMLLGSLVAMLGINRIEAWARKKTGTGLPEDAA
ncbi:MAG: sulfate ABC transporter permease subunit CysT [Polyangiaceae bacterium]